EIEAHPSRIPAVDRPQRSISCSRQAARRTQIGAPLRSASTSGRTILRRTGTTRLFAFTGKGHACRSAALEDLADALGNAPPITRSAACPERHTQADQPFKHSFMKAR